MSGERKLPGVVALSGTINGELAWSVAGEMEYTAGTFSFYGDLETFTLRGVLPDADVELPIPALLAAIGQVIADG